MGTSPTQPAADDQRLIALGKIVAPFGVRGWVKALAFTDEVDEILDYQDLQLVWPSGETRQLRLAEGRVHSKGLVLRFEGIADRDAAEALARAELMVERGELPALAEGEYYRDDLLDFEVVNLQGEALGRVDHFVDTPANAIMVVSGDRERWLPLVPQYLKQVDLAGRQLVVDWDQDF